MLTIDIVAFLLREFAFLVLCKLIPLFLLLFEFRSFRWENFLMETDCKAGNAV